MNTGANHAAKGMIHLPKENTSSGTAMANQQ